MGSGRSVPSAELSDGPYNLLIAGYLRSIYQSSVYSKSALLPPDPDHDDTASNSKIPLTLLHLCVNFYLPQMRHHLILWSGTLPQANNACNGISLMNISNYSLSACTKHAKLPHSVYRFNIHNLDDHNYCNVEWSEQFDRNHSSYALLSFGDTLPSWVTQKFKSTFSPKTRQYLSASNKSSPSSTPSASPGPSPRSSASNLRQLIHEKDYQLIVRIGSDNVKQSRCDVLIFDGNLNNIKHHKQKLIEAYYSAQIEMYPKMPHLNNTTMTQNDHKWKGLVFGYGGKLKSKQIWNNVYSLDVNTLKYRRYSALSTAKQGVTMTLDNNKNVLIMGGENSKTCELLKQEVIDNKVWMDEDQVHCVKIADMHYERMNAASTFFYANDHRIIVGGGRGQETVTSHSAELYDMNADKWTVVSGKMNKAHYEYPVIWNDAINENIVYIAGDVTRNQFVKNLGHIEWYDLRENKKKWNVSFQEVPINRLFGLTKKNNTDKKNWVSRALLA